MLKIDSINTSQNKLDYYTKNANSETNVVQKSTTKDTFIKSNKIDDSRYALPALKNNKETENNKETTQKKESTNYKEIINPNKDNILVNGTKTITNLIGPDISRVTYSNSNEFAGDLSYQLFLNINKDAHKQIEILDKYNLIKTIEANK
jgi:hypothetical protein